MQTSWLLGEQAEVEFPPKETKLIFLLKGKNSFGGSMTEVWWFWWRSFTDLLGSVLMDGHMTFPEASCLKQTDFSLLSLVYAEITPVLSQCPHFR